ncbi:hypothetical protein ACFSC3_03445 [Sphingomonas floccifaciens]|uniref:Uncharacterized protein n=1 Tax=Sphingomonas floccifaciens TaxID=1844115 RepID=A0ABW4NCY6_9SPHN
MGEENPTNEIVAAAQDAKARTNKARRKDDKGHWPLKAIGLGVGIGSAAVAAAMLYSNRDRRGDD